MPTAPAVIAALDSLSAPPEPFGEEAINALFRACIAAAGSRPAFPTGLKKFNRLWESDSVLSAVETMQETHEAKDDTTAARKELIARIEAEIRE